MSEVSKPKEKKERVDILLGLRKENPDNKENPYVEVKPIGMNLEGYVLLMYEKIPDPKNIAMFKERVTFKASPNMVKDIARVNRMLQAHAMHAQLISKKLAEQTNPKIAVPGSPGFQQSKFRPPPKKRRGR